MKTRQFDQLPKALVAYPKVVQGLIQKKPRSKDKSLPQVEYTVKQLSIDPQHLKKYNDICGFAQDGTVAAIYLTVLAQSLQMHMMTSEPFPFALLGLVHIRNKVKQYRIIKASETISLSCKFGELKPHDKGLQFDFIITAKVGDEVIVEGLTTYLSRQKVQNTNADKPKTDQVPDYVVQDSWRLAENTGRRYAMISGDFNLIHIHALTAKAFGFKSAIAHGMWTKARALAALGTLPQAYEVDVQFKLPVFLPSEVEFLLAKDEQLNTFLVRNIKSHKPHLSGELKPLI